MLCSTPRRNSLPLTRRLLDSLTRGRKRRIDRVNALRRSGTSDVARQIEMFEDRTLLSAVIGNNIEVGDEIQSYRLAIAATAEYTAFFGGQAQALAQIESFVAEANAVFETELAIHFDLVSDTNTIFTNAVTDGYTNGSTASLINENTAILNSVLGSDGYDIGHVFGTQTAGGASGLAGLGVVNGFGKGRGASTGSNPQGDGWNSLVMHELGHQFGAEHTFNADAFAAAVGNREASSAYEPASGSTLMSYAGISGADNLQLDEDNYFHAASFEEIQTFIAGAGTPNTTFATGNSIPTVSGGTDFTIPAGTPFELTATGSDADLDTLTYTWEQLDLGPAMSLPLFDNGSSPLFRSFTGTTEPSRVFPRLDDLLDNVNTAAIGEVLPTTTRDLNFRTTVRDGNSGVNSDDVLISVVDTGTPFAVTSPNTSVNWTGGTTQTISWDVGGTTANGINVANVAIELSLDGGQTYPFALATSTANDGSHTIDAPNIAASEARLRIRGLGNVFFDVSDTDFTITSDAGNPGVTVVETGGGTSVTEEGVLGGTQTDTYTLALNTTPTGAVSILVSADAQTEVSLDGITFASSVVVTRTDMTAQTITVRGFDDTVEEGIHSGTITHSISASADADYSVGTPVNPVTASIADDELQPIVGIDFDEVTGESPTNWTTVSDVFGSTTTDLLREDGIVTPYDLQIAVSGSAGAQSTSSPANLPNHSPSLAEIGGLRLANNSITLTWSGLAAGALYDLYLFVAENFGQDANQTVTITGGTSPAVFTMDTSSVGSQLLVNSVVADPTRTLSDDAVRATATATGEITIVVTDVGTDFVFLSGAAIAEVVPTVTLTRDNADIDEAAGVATYTATLSTPSSEDVIVNLGYSGTATRATDYTAPDSIVITAGNTIGTATVAAVQDSDVEPNETIIVDITSVTNATESGVQQATTTITDDDDAPAGGPGELIGIDFDGRFSAPNNWSQYGTEADTTLFDVIDESGAATLVDIDINFDFGIGEFLAFTPAADQLPIHSQSLAGLTETYTDLGNVVVTFEDLTPGAEYELYVFGGADFSATQTVEVFDHASDPFLDTPIDSFTQSFTSNQLFVNSQAGSDQNTLESYARVYEADANGNLTVRVRSIEYAVAGMAIRAAAAPQPDVWINELHYNNTGADIGEFVEVAGAAGTDLSGLSLVFYDGATGAQYSTVALSGTIDDENSTGFGALQFAAAGQDGPDGVALVNGATVLEFLSYGGIFAATDGPAIGLTSVDIGVAESEATAVGDSLQRDNTVAGVPGVWFGPNIDSPGDLNSLPQNLVVTPTVVGINEGATNTVTVSLAAQPAADVTVTVARTSGDADITGDITLTFTAANWNIGQDVTLTAAEDDDAVDGSAVFTISSAGLDSVDVTANEIDNDTQELVVTPTTLDVDEGATTTFSVALAAQPAADVTVTIAKDSGDADVTGGTTLTFTSTNWNTAQDVTITAAEDADAENGSATFTVSSTGLTSVDVTANEVENDVQSLVVTPGTISVGEGTTNTFSVALAAQPTADVTVTVARTSGDSDLTGDTTLTFTSSNWNTAQDVTITAAEDADAVNGSAVFTVSSAGLTSDTVTATEVDNDEQGLVVTPVTVAVNEGATNTFAVRLAAQPTADVTVTIVKASGDGDLTGAATLTFTTANWNTAQDVTITAAEDADTINGSADFTVLSAGLTNVTVTANEVDNDSLSIVVSAPDVAVDEGSANLFGVLLSAQPTADVTVNIARTSGDTDLTGSATLTFTPGNWNTPQDVTISAAEDADADNGSAVFSVSSTGLANVDVTANEVDNDSQQLVVTPGSINVDEGSTNTFSVALSAQPAADVTVTIARTSGDTDLSGDTTLTFTSANWNTPQDVAITAAEDADAVNGSAVFTVSSAGLTNASVTANEVDNDQQGLVVTPNTVAVNEGATSTFAVSLAAQPIADVTVTITKASGDADLTGDTTLTFTPTNWNTTQDVTLEAAEDADTVNGTADFTVSSTGLTSVTVTANEVDNDQQSLVVTPTTVAVDEGASNTFAVSLAAQPVADVTVTIAKTSGDVDLTGGTTLTFTPANWNTTQNVTITAADDADAINGTADFTVSSTGLTSVTVTADEVENDVQGLVVTPTTVAVNEGATNSFSVRLAAQPTADVTVVVAKTSGDADLTGAATLTFTPANWNTAQDVTLTAAEDVDGVNGSAVFAATSSGLTTVNVTANEVENDVQGLVVAPGTVNVDEGSTNNFTVALAVQPTADVTVTVARTSGDTDLTGDTTLTFTAANWNIAQAVTITAADDADAVNGQANFAVSSAGLPTVNVTANEIENDTQALVITPSTVAINEGATNTFAVSLSAQPIADVTVTIVRSSGDADLTGATTLTFTPANWNIEQDVTITAAEDDDAVNGTADFTASSAGLTSVTVTANEIDNDTQGLVVAPVTVGVNEGATNTFSVALAAQPVGDITVTVAKASGDIDLTGSATLTFTSANWNVAQDVTLSAADDADAANGTADFTVSSAGLTNVTVTANEVDNDSQQLVVTPSTVAVNEGATNTFAVRLSAQPTTDVTVTVARSSGDTDLTGNTTLTFTPANWNTAQDVTITAAEDADADNGSAVFAVSSSGLAGINVTVNEADNDTQSLVVTPAIVSVVEGASSTFAVSLAAQPTADVTVTVTRDSGDTDLSGNTTLTFTPANWDTPQDVTISAAEDADAVNDSAVFTVASVGLANETVTANEVENDTQGLVVSSTTVAVNEGTTNSFGVSLAAQPTTDVTVTVVRASGDGDLTGSATLTFTPTNWNTAQNVTLTAEEDADAVNGSADFTVSSAGLADVTVAANEVDNDTQELVVTPATVGVNEGSASAFSVALAAQPTGDVTVNVAKTSGDADLTGAATLTFTPTNWNTPQDVTLSAAEDADGANGTATFAVSSTGLTTVNVTANEIENDVQGLVVAPTSVSVDEGSTSTFGVALAVQPTTNVTVTIARTSGDSGLTGNTTLTFTPANWNTAQNVTVSAAEDADAANGSAVFTVSSTGLTGVDVAVSEVDNDTQGLVVTPTTVSVNEGATNAFAVSLAAQPTANVTVNVAKAAGDADLTGTTTLTFTPANWNTAQDVTVTATEDTDAINGTAEFTVTSAGLADVTVTANEVDNDTLGLVVAPTVVAVDEGASTTFAVTLSAQPTTNVTVNVVRTSGDTDLTGNTTLTFTPANWNTPQDVTLSAAEDADADIGFAVFTVSSSGLASVNVTANEVENDTQQLVVTPTTVAINEGASSTFSVALAAQPTTNITVTVARSSGDTDVTGDTTLTFTPANWAAAQNVTLSAAEDTDNIDGTAEFTVSSAGLTDVTVTANEVDDDVPDSTPPESSVDPLPAFAAGKTFTVSVSGTDPSSLNPNESVSGVATYDIYVATDFGSYSLWTTVSAASPSAVFSGNSNTRYHFISIAKDAAGNTEDKDVTSAANEAWTIVLDFDAPNTAVTNVDSTTQTFVVDFEGTDPADSGVAVFEVWVSVDGAAPQLHTTVTAGDAVAGVHTGSVLYTAISDGVSHSYRFYTIGIDESGNRELVPTGSNDDITVTATFTPPPSLETTGLDVQNGDSQRSFIQFVDVSFNDSAGLAAIVASMNDGNTTNDRIQLIRFNLDGSGPGISVDTGTVSTDGAEITLDFGANGITGNPNSNAGDGYYQLSVDLDGDGTADQDLHFYRMMGDTNGDRRVDRTDLLNIFRSFHRPNRSDADLNGDGVVNVLDLIFTLRNNGQSVDAGLLLDD